MVNLRLVGPGFKAQNYGLFRQTQDLVVSQSHIDVLELKNPTKKPTLDVYPCFKIVNNTGHYFLPTMDCSDKTQDMV